MADVAVISPNVVELVGSLLSPARATAPPLPPPRNDPALKSRDPAGGGSRGLAANSNNLPVPPRPRDDDRPQSRSSAERPPGQPSTTFLTQLLAQGAGNAAANRLDTAIAAYARASAYQPAAAPTGVAFLTGTIDRTV